MTPQETGRLSQGDEDHKSKEEMKRFSRSEEDGATRKTDGAESARKVAEEVRLGKRKVGEQDMKVRLFPRCPFGNGGKRRSECCAEGSQSWAWTKSWFFKIER